LEEKKLTKPKRQRRKRVPKSRDPGDASASDPIIPGTTSIEDVSPPASFTNYHTLPIDMVVTPEETVVKPDLPKTMVTLIRPASMVKEDSFTGRATDFMESMKDKTEDAIDSIKSATGVGVSRTVSNIDLEPLVIPIIEQKSTIKTKGYTESIRIEKRQAERKKNIEINVKYDEIFINGKEIHTNAGDTLREIRDKILEIVSFDQDRDEKELEKVKGQMIPLLGNDTEMERVIPLYAEEVIISKKMTKVGDLTIRKRKVSETRKVDIDLITEQVTIQNPTGGSSSSLEDEG
jgi:stress response protein YsnF